MAKEKVDVTIQYTGVTQKQAMNIVDGSRVLKDKYAPGTITTAFIENKKVLNSAPQAKALPKSSGGKNGK